MTIFNANQFSPQDLINLVKSRLLAVQGSLNDLHDLQSWMLGQVDADFTGAGMDPGDLGKIRSAMADAHVYYQLHTVGTMPGSYTLPYTFGNSQRIVIGPPKG
jgi:hypothetical protein